MNEPGQPGPEQWTQLPPGMLPDPAWFHQTGRPCVVHHKPAVFVIVIWLDTGDVNVYGNPQVATRAWWEMIQRDGHGLVERLRIAEAKAEGMERGQFLTVRKEIESRLVELRPGTYTLPDDRERLLTDLTG